MINDELKFLPFSGGRYQINQFSEIFSRGQRLETRLKDKVKVVHLSWYDGDRDYEVGVIVAIVYFNINIPTNHWNKVETIYEDGNTSNTFPLNISYRFKDGPIPIENHPDFFFIPYYTRYGINKDGDILSLSTNKIKKWLVTKPVLKKNITGGYRNASARIDTDQHRFIARHRAIGLTFVRYESNPLKLVINHKDGIPGNDVPTNLEWVTRAENNKHAYSNNLFPNKVVKILMKDLETGEIKAYPSIAKCALENNWTYSFVVHRLNKPNIRYSDNIVFKIDNGSDWPVLEINRSSTVFQDVIFRNVFTGITTIVNSCAEASRLTGVKRATIEFHCKNLLRLPTNGFNFRYLDSKSEWPTFNDKQLQILKKYPSGNRSSGVLVRDDKGNEIEFYESISLASTAYSVPYDCMYTWCRNESVCSGKKFELVVL